MNMGAHINKDGLWQSDKYPTCPAGKVPLSVKDPTAQDVLWEYAQRRRKVDAEFSADLEHALKDAGFVPETTTTYEGDVGADPLEKTDGQWSRDSAVVLTNGTSNVVYPRYLVGKRHVGKRVRITVTILGDSRK